MCSQQKPITDGDATEADIRCKAIRKCLQLRESSPVQRKSSEVPSSVRIRRTTTELSGDLSVAAGGSQRVWSRGDCSELWRQRRCRQRPDSDSCARAGRWRCGAVGGSGGSRTGKRLQPDHLQVLLAYRLDR